MIAAPQATVCFLSQPRRIVSLALSFLTGAILFAQLQHASAQDHQPAAESLPLAFQFEQIGPPPFFRPRITNVQIADLDRDGHNDVIVCDSQASALYCYRRIEFGGWEEQLLGENLIAPAHATVVDIDQDGDNDVLASVMGNLYPDDGVIGSLVLLENRDGRFVKKVLLDDVRRVVDAQPADFDGDGDLDLAVAVFGYLRGQVLWLENKGNNEFLDHELLYAPGTIHVPVADFDGDGDLDITAIVSQDEEEVWGFENLGKGKFQARRLWFTVNFDIGSAGLVQTDLDSDGDTDLLLPVGDNLEDGYSIPLPYHGCLWLENQGNWKFAEHRLANFAGTYAAASGDLDVDGDTDVVLCSMVNDWDSPDAASVIWLENNGQQQFQQHTVAREPIMMTTLACGDLNGDDFPDLVAGGLHLFRPYNRLGRVSSWLTRKAKDDAAPVAAGAQHRAKPDFSEQSVPLPDLESVDALTKADLEKNYQRTLSKAAAGEINSADWLTLGQAYYSHGLFAAARESFQRAVALEPKSVLANYLYGVSLSRLGQMSAAIEQFETTLAIDGSPQHPGIWYEIGRCQLRLERPKEAEAAFLKAGNHPRALAHLVKLRVRSERAAEAVQPLNTLSRLQPGTTEIFLLNHQVTTALGSKEQAQQFRDRSEYNEKKLPLDLIAKTVQQVSSKYGVMRIGDVAKQHLADKEWDQAARLLTQIVEAHPDKDAIILLAGSERERGNFETSIALLKDLIQQQGATPQAMFQLGESYLAKGETSKAQSIWEALAEHRSQPELHDRLAKLYASQGDEPAAKRQRALKLQATGVDALRHSNPQAARSYLQQAVDLEPELPKAWFYLGECQRFLGQPAAAREAYRRTLKLAPNHGRALTALQLLSAS